MRVVVTGSRTWVDILTIRRVLLRLQGKATARGEGFRVAHGACKTGADALTTVLARRHGWELETYPVKSWRLGPSEGPKRNRRMLDTEKPDIVVGFLDSERLRITGVSGTLGCLEEAEKRGIPFELYAK